MRPVVNHAITIREIRTSDSPCHSIGDIAVDWNRPATKKSNERDAGGWLSSAGMGPIRNHVDEEMKRGGELGTSGAVDRRG